MYPRPLVVPWTSTISPTLKISNLIKYLDLNAGVESWAKEIEKSSVEAVEYSGLEAWDMNYIVKQLEALYENDKRG